LSFFLAATQNQNGATGAAWLDCATIIGYSSTAFDDQILEMQTALGGDKEKTNRGEPGRRSWDVGRAEDGRRQARHRSRRWPDTDDL
jgi:hypothetical protein